MCQEYKPQTIKLIVAGGRDFSNEELLISTLCKFADSTPDAVEIVSGMAKGADLIAYEFARNNRIVCHSFPADWETYGKSAGFRRNAEMADFADRLLAFWDGESRGTKNMIELMKIKGKPVEVILY